MAKNFKDLFESMTQAVAMKTLGLTGAYSDDDVKAAYRQAAKANHPDRGGSTEKMQAVNSAYDLLKGTAGKAEAARESFQDKQARAKEEKQVIYNFVSHMFDKFFDLNAYLAYFKEMSGGKTFHVERNIVSGSWGSTTVTYKFYDDEKSIFFDMTAYAQVFITKALGAGIDKPELDKMGISTDVLVNRAKHKMTQSNYNREETEKFMKDPTVLFPKAKLKKIFGGSAKVKKLKKADYILTIKKEMDAKHLGGDDYSVDIGEGFNLYLSRISWMRKGFWSFSGRNTNDKTRFSVTAGMPEVETSDSLDALIDMYKTLKKKSGKTNTWVESELTKHMSKLKVDLTNKGLY